jgi:hypothetical protein
MVYMTLTGLSGGSAQEQEKSQAHLLPSGSKREHGSNVPGEMTSYPLNSKIWKKFANISISSHDLLDLEISMNFGHVRGKKPLNRSESKFRKKLQIFFTKFNR